MSRLPLLLASGCLVEQDRQPEVERLIKEMTEERLANYERIRTERCREGILDEATRIVDSLLIEEARKKKAFSDRPEIPSKPDRPEIVQLQDTTPLEPLLSEQDSLILPDSLKN